MSGGAGSWPSYVASISLLLLAGVPPPLLLCTSPVFQTSDFVPHQILFHMEEARARRQERGRGWGHEFVSSGHTVEMERRGVHQTC